MSNQAERDSRTEPATPKKREEARAEGKVAQSQELIQAIHLLVALLLLFLLGTSIMQMLKESFRILVSSLDGPQLELDTTSVTRLLRQQVVHVVTALWPFVLILLVAAATASYVQVGFRITPARLKLSFEKLDPVQGLLRLFSIRSVVRAAYSLAKILLISALVYDSVQGAFPRLSRLSGRGLGPAVETLGGLVFELSLRVGLAMLLLAIFDLVFQRRQLEVQLRMSKQEVKEEQKSVEGDPALKARIRQLQRERARARMMEAVPKATVVVVNPTHFSAALHYDREHHLAPVLSVKGQGLVALRIRELAREHGIPIVENKPLARELFRVCELGDEVPEHLYEATARLLAFVLRRGRSGTASGMGERVSDP